eukprot:gb/GECG01011113.1/.p1 GENE.gb/GECG01011113.1/~~gb/GECG01011113.1/.p1  ORF type:complete len:441 (+),score=71.99 gb/GECG01011113.1/:1-1323(+)
MRRECCGLARIAPAAADGTGIGMAQMAQPMQGSGTNAASDSDTCCICLEPITELGKINGCSHLFCYQCIEEWSKVTNLCPLCKVKFTQIEGKTPSPNGRKQRKKKCKRVRNRRQRVDHYEDEVDVEAEDEVAVEVQAPRTQRRRRHPARRAASGRRATSSTTNRSAATSSVTDDDLFEMPSPPRAARRRLRRRAPRSRITFYQEGTPDVDDSDGSTVDLTSEEESAALEAIYFGTNTATGASTAQGSSDTATQAGHAGEDGEGEAPQDTSHASSSRQRIERGAPQRRPLVWIQSQNSAGRTRWTRARRECLDLNINEIVEQYGRQTDTAPATASHFESDSLIERIQRRFEEQDQRETSDTTEEPTTDNDSVSSLLQRLQCRCGEENTNNENTMNGTGIQTTENESTSEPEKTIEEEDDDEVPLSLQERLQRRLHQQTETL